LRVALFALIQPVLLLTAIGLRFDLQTPNFDVREMLCSPTDLAEYNKLIGNPLSGQDSK